MAKKNELEQRIDKAEKELLLAKKKYDEKLEILAGLLQERDRISRGLDGGRVSLERWDCTWNGRAVWDYGTGVVHCFYQAKMAFEKSEGEIRGAEIQRLEMEQPGFSAEDAVVVLQDSLRKWLDSEFEEYCTEDDYYQPVVEDFEAEYCAREWAEERGMELVSFEGGGSDGGYEPKFRGRR